HVLDVEETVERRPAVIAEYRTEDVYPNKFVVPPGEARDNRPALPFAPEHTCVHGLRPPSIFVVSEVEEASLAERVARIPGHLAEALIHADQASAVRDRH